MPKGRYYKGKSAKNKRFEDSQMIREDSSQVANLPQKEIMMKYPETPYIDTPYLDDTARGVDVQMARDVKESKRKVYPEKY